MPVPVLQSFAKKSGKSIEELERYWNEAKEAATKKGLDPDSPQYFAFVTAVVKQRAGLKENLIDFCKWIAIEGAELLKEEGEAEVSPEEQADIDAKAEFARAAADRGEEPPRPPLIRQFMKSKGKTEQEVRRIWDEAKAQAVKWQERNGTTDQQMLDVALDIMHEIMNQIPAAAPPEEEEKEEEKPKEEDKEEGDEEEDKENAPAEEDKEKEKKENAPAGDEKAANEAWAVFMQEVLGEARVNIKNVLSKDEMKAFNKAGIDFDALSDKELKNLTRKFKKEKKKIQKANQKEIDNAKDDLVKGKKHKPGKTFLDAIMLGGLGFVGGLAAITAANTVLDKAFKIFRIG